MKTRTLKPRLNQKPSNMECGILKAIGPSSVYGLEIMRIYNDNEAGRCRLNIGSLYVTLKRMESKGMIKGFLGESVHIEGGNRRRYYSLTEIGIQMLENCVE